MKFIIKYKNGKIFKEFTLEELEKLFNKKANTNLLSEIKNIVKENEGSKIKLSKKLNEKFREVLNVIPSSKWDSDLKIIIMLFGKKNKCNAISINEEDKTFKLCSKSPSKDDNGDTNGRCSVHAGKVKENSNRKPNGRKKGENKDNQSAVKTGKYTRRRSELLIEVKKEFFNPNISKLQGLIKRLEDEIAYQMVIIREIEHKGIKILDEEEIEVLVDNEGKVIYDVEGKPLMSVKEKFPMKQYLEAKSEYAKLEALYKQTIALIEETDDGLEERLVKMFNEISTILKNNDLTPSESVIHFEENEDEEVVFDDLEDDGE